VPLSADGNTHERYMERVVEASMIKLSTQVDNLRKLGYGRSEADSRRDRGPSG
jgi:hypothetical protein